MITYETDLIAVMRVKDEGVVGDARFAYRDSNNTKWYITNPRFTSNWHAKDFINKWGDSDLHYILVPYQYGAH